MIYTCTWMQMKGIVLANMELDLLFSISEPCHAMLYVGSHVGLEQG